MADTLEAPRTSQSSLRAGAESAVPPMATPGRTPVTAGSVDGGPRTVRLTLARVDPLSVMKLSFLLSVALGIALVVATVVIWQLLKSMGVFSSIDGLIGDVATAQSGFDIYDYVGLSRVVSLATFIAVINVLIAMALATAGAVLYNISASLVGGLHVTLSDD